MQRYFFAAAITASLSLAHMTSAQTTTPAGNNPTAAGVYVEGMLGVNIASEIDFDFDNPIFNDFTADPEVGFLGGLAVGYSIPQGPINIRMEGELAGRTNGVDEIDFDVTGEVELDDADVSSIAGMLNAYLDYYFLPNFAATVGAGIGYANVTPDLAIIDDDTSGFAYQGRLGGRYNFSSNSAVTFGYTYFATTELEVDDEDGDELTFDYANHGFHLGYAFQF